VEKYTSGQSTDVNVIGRMHVACWITKAADTHPEYVIHFSSGYNGYVKMPQCYIYMHVAFLVF